MSVLYISAELEEVLRLSHPSPCCATARWSPTSPTGGDHHRHDPGDHRRAERTSDHAQPWRRRHERASRWRALTQPPPVLARRDPGRPAARQRRLHPRLLLRPDDGRPPLRQPHLILQFGSPLILVALGMTLVIATGGIDLSVGAVVAITGALACSYISDQADRAAWPGCCLAMALGLASRSCCGLWNGFLVARMGIQPIIATLIIMVAGRGVAQLITDGQIITVNSAPYKLIGGGYWLTCPFAVLLVAASSPSPRADPPHRTRPADRVGRRQRRGQPPGRHPRPRAHQIMVYIVLRAVRRHRGTDDQLQHLGRRRQQRRPVDRTRRDPRRRHRRHLAAGRPVLPRRHGRRRPGHPDP